MAFKLFSSFARSRIILAFGAMLSVAFICKQAPGPATGVDGGGPGTGNGGVTGGL